MNATCERSGITWMMSPTSSAPAPSAPVQDRAAAEVPAAADQRQAVAEVERLAVPVLDRRVRAHDPLGVGGVQVDRAVEALRPLDHRRVVVRMRDRDRREPAAALDLGGGRVVEQRDAVPQQVRVAVGDEQRALADGELRLGPDADEVALRRGSCSRGRRRRSSSVVHCLAAKPDVLARVGADRARLRRALALGELGPARHADRHRHGANPRARLLWRSDAARASSPDARPPARPARPARRRRVPRRPRRSVSRSLARPAA